MAIKSGYVQMKFWIIYFSNKFIGFFESLKIVIKKNQSGIVTNLNFLQTTGILLSGSEFGKDLFDEEMILFSWFWFWG